jgi:tetratricopeptide (TPR) repeat protein
VRRNVITVWLVFAGALPTAWSDCVKLRDKPAFRGVTVTDFRRGGIVFRGLSRQYLHKPLEQVDWIEIDKAPAFNAAERAGAAGKWTEAAAGYAEALAATQEAWLRDLVSDRLLKAHDRAGQFDCAVSLYAGLVVNKNAMVVGQTPRHPGPPGSVVNSAAREALERAIARARADGAATVTPLRVLLLELLIYDRADIPSELAVEPESRPGAAASRGASTTSAPATAPAVAPYMLLGSKRNAPPVSLPADSFVLHAAEKALEAGDAKRANGLLERALPYVPAEEAWPWRLVLGRARIADGRYPEAAAELMSLAETDPDVSRRAWALYYVGLAHERMDRPDVAAKAYREVTEQPALPAGLTALANEGLERTSR